MTAKPTIHFAVVRVMRPIVGGHSIGSFIAHDDPDARRSALYIINSAWCVLAFVLLVASAVMGVLVRMVALLAASSSASSVAHVPSAWRVARMSCGVGTGICRRRVGGFVRTIVPRMRSTCGGRCRVTAASSFSPSSGF
jgi:hypothetical protein